MRWFCEVWPPKRQTLEEGPTIPRPGTSLATDRAEGWNTTTPNADAEPPERRRSPDTLRRWLRSAAAGSRSWGGSSSRRCPWHQCLCLSCGSRADVAGGGAPAERAVDAAGAGVFGAAAAAGAPGWIVACTCCSVMTFGGFSVTIVADSRSPTLNWEMSTGLPSRMIVMFRFSTSPCVKFYSHSGRESGPNHPTPE